MTELLTLSIKTSQLFAPDIFRLHIDLIAKRRVRLGISERDVKVGFEVGLVPARKRFAREMRLKLRQKHVSERLTVMFTSRTHSSLLLPSFVVLRRVNAVELLLANLPGVLHC